MNDDLSQCDICKEWYPPVELWAFRRKTDDRELLELWCSSCYVPYLQRELDLADMMALKFTQILGTIAEELRAAPLGAINEAAHHLIVESLKAKPDRQKHLDRLIALLVARMNYNTADQHRALVADFGWSWGGAGHAFRKLVIIIDHDKDERLERHIEAENAIAAFEHDIRKIVEEILGEELWSASRSKA